MNDLVETGLLTTFRRFIVVVWLLLSLTVCSAVSEPQPVPNYFAVFSWVFASLLLVYLSWPWLRRRLGRAHLPVALVLVSVVPVCAHAAAIFLNLAHGLSAEEALIEPGSLFLWLVLPLLLVSLQYRMQAMLLFTFGTALLIVLVAIPNAVLGGPPVRIAIEHAITQIVLFTVVGYVVVRIARAQREQRNLLQRQNTELAHYATSLEMLAISRERNRMARELHDTLAHTLSAVNVQLKALEVVLDYDTNAAKKLAVETQALTRDGLNEARRALHALRASPIDAFGCVLAIENMAQSRAEQAGLELRLDLPVQITGISLDVEQNLYRIVEEAINNVIRHAKAKTLSIVLYQAEDGGVELTISDDGKGFNPRRVDAKQHYGITGMYERALLCGGDLKIESQPGAGTTLNLKIERKAT